MATAATPTDAGAHGSYSAPDVHWLWGKLNWDIFPFYDPLIFVTCFCTMVLVAVRVAGLTYYRLC